MTKQTKLPLPAHVSPLGVRFQVQVLDDVDEEGSVGETAAELRLIKVASAQDTRRRWTTLLHEYIHATLDVVGVASVIDEQLEEVIVQSLEHSLEQFLLAHGTDLLKALEVQK